MADPTGRISHIPQMHRGVAWKQPVRAATTANITRTTALNDGDTLDGVTLASGDRVLVKDQSDASQNGIFVVAGTPYRDYDMDQDATTSVPATEIVGSFVYVIEGTANGSTLWYCTTTGTPVIDTDDITFGQWITGTPAPGSASLPFIDVTAQGMVGDDATDNGSAFQAIINGLTGGELLYFPPGIYRIGATVNIDVENVTLMGAGNEYGPSVIKMTASNTTALNFNYAFATADVGASIVRGLVVTGPGSASSGYGINVTADVFLEHVGVHGFYVGVQLSTTCYYTRISDCLITNNAAIGIYGAGTNNVRIERCRINGYHASAVPPFGDQNSGVVLEGVLGFSIRDSAIEAHDLVAIEITGNSSVNPTTLTGVISGCYFEANNMNSGGRYVYLHGTSGKPVRGVLVESCYFQAVNVASTKMVEGTYAEYTTLTNNAFGYGGTNQAAAVTTDANSSGWLMLNNEVIAGNVTLPTNSVRLDEDTGWPVVNPMTTAGDLIYGGASGAATRRGIGTSGQVLKVTGGVPDWADSPLPRGEILVADTPSGTPISFVDLLTDESELDLLYGDP